MSDAGSRPCRYCELGDGRTLAYAEWGASDGRPVLYCHGFPGSRLEARLADAAAARLGVRLIAPDRPGFGRSPLQPGRRLGDWPRDLALFADRLGIDRFALLGVSGGGPYALAAGAHLGDRIARIAIACGLGRLDTPGATRGMNAAAATGVRFYLLAPALARRAYAHAIGPLLGRFPEQVLRILVGTASAADRDVLADPQVRDTVTASFREAFHGGAAGPAQELGLFTRPWDFDPRAVRVPVQLWHGDDDHTVPVAMGRRHAALLPDVDARFIAGEGHFSLLVRHLERILGALVAPPD